MSNSVYSLAIGLFLCLNASPLAGQGFGYPSCPKCNPQPTPDWMDTRQFTLLDYRRMFKQGRTPCNQDLMGYWRGANKGIVELAGYRQFIKEIVPDGSCIKGDNIQVGQVNQDVLRSIGWQPKIDELTGQPERNGKFSVLPPHGRGTFGHGTVFSYREGGNTRLDPVNLLVDKVVMINENHLLGRVTAKFGLIEIPLAYFVLERM